MRHLIAGAVVLLGLGGFVGLTIVRAQVPTPTCTLSADTNYVPVGGAKTTVVVTWHTQNANGFVIQARDGATRFRGGVDNGSTTVATNQALDVVFTALSGSQTEVNGTGTYGLCTLYIP